MYNEISYYVFLVLGIIISIIQSLNPKTKKIYCFIYFIVYLIALNVSFHFALSKEVKNSQHLKELK